MAYTVKDDPIFGATGSGLGSAFQPLYGDPELDKGYFSWLVNQPPALGGFALRATKAAIQSTYRTRLGQAPGLRHVVQLKLSDGTEFTSDSMKWLNFQDLVATDLEKIERSERNKHAVLGLGLARGFETLRTHGALSMDPSLTPRLDKIGKAPGELPTSYMRILRLVTELYTAEWQPASLSQNNKSHFGLLKPTRVKEDKIDFIINKIVKAHGHNFIDKLGEYDAEWFVQNFGTAPCVIATPRFQLDKIGKIRGGFNWLGKEIPASNKSIPVELAGMYASRMTALRQRVAYAVDGACNAVIAPAFAGWRSIALNKYPLTWHTASDEDLLGPILKYGHYREYDAANFDTSYSREEIDLITSSLLHATDRLKAAISTVSHLPMVVKSDERDVAGAFLVNNRTYRAGHQSGVAWVSDYNKIRGTAHWIFGLLRINKLDGALTDTVLKSEIDVILRHAHPDYALLNQGDDTLPFCTDEVTLEAWCKAVEELDFAIWEKDDAHKVLGKVIFQDNPNAPLRIIPDAVTLVERMLINERSMHSNHRKLSAMGNLERLRMLSVHPAAGVVMPVLDRHAISCFGDTLQRLYEKARQFDKTEEELLENSIGDIDMGSLNAATRAYIVDPDVIHYKYDISEIDPGVYKIFNSAIPANDAAWMTRRLKLISPSAHPDLSEDLDASATYKTTQVSEFQRLRA